MTFAVILHRPQFEADAKSPIVEALVSDGVALGIWGYLRLSSRPVSLSEITEQSRLVPVVAQRKLDALCAYGIAELIPASGRRRSITYRAKFDGLRIRFRKAGDEQVRWKIAAAMQRHAKELLATEPAPLRPAEPQRWGKDFSGTVHLRPAEAEELRRRIDRVVEFTTLLGDRYAKRGDAPSLCNYVIDILAKPLANPALPMVPVRFVQLDGDAPNEEDADRPARLSARERETALALARGLTIAEVAAELGVARSTASTLTKRIYAKLGVHRRAEMVSRLQELLGDSAG